MKKYFALILASIILSACTSDKKKALEHFIKSKDFLKNDDIRNASMEIELAIELDSSNLDFQIIKAEIIEKTDNYEKAIKILKKLLTKNFKSDTVNYKIGICYFGYGRYFEMTQNDNEKCNSAYENALIYFDNALTCNMYYCDAYIEKQKILHNLNRSSEALAVLNTAIKIFPDNLQLICNRGVEKWSLGDMNGALTDLNKSIQSKELDSMDCSSAYRFRGHLYQQKGEFEIAIRDFTNAISQNPKEDLAFLSRAKCYQEMGLRDKACEDFRKAADLGYIGLYQTIQEYCGN